MAATLFRMAPDSTRARRDDPGRFDPDALLALVHEARGRLHVPRRGGGCGRALGMLAQGRRRTLRGADVVVGFTGTHGRAET